MAKSTAYPFTLVGKLAAMDSLHNAQLHLRQQFNVLMSRAEALAHFQARSILANAAWAISNEIEVLLSEVAHG